MELRAVSPDLNAGAEDKIRQRDILKPGAKSDEKSRKEARKVAREFEAVFTGFMIKAMRETTGKDKLTGGGRGEDIYRTLLDQEYALAIAQQGSLGIADNIEKQLLRNTIQPKKQPANNLKGTEIVASEPNGGG